MCIHKITPGSLTAQMNPPLCEGDEVLLLNGLDPVQEFNGDHNKLVK